MSHSDPAPEPVVVFHTPSNIEASVVMALLDSQGIDSFRVSGNPHAIWPLSAAQCVRQGSAYAQSDHRLGRLERPRA